MRNNIIAVQEQAARLKKPMFAHINHPNFGWSITAEDIAHVLEEKFFEVYNGHPSINHMGNAQRPGDEKIWDIANTIRLSKLDALPLFGVASDDSHHYHGGDSKPGRGWIMVNSSTLNEDTIVNSINAGNFYATSGVHFKHLRRNQQNGILEFEIKAEDGIKYVTKITGTKKGEENDPRKIGKVLASFEGVKVKYQLSKNDWYFRATVHSSKNHPKPSFKEQMEKARTQPLCASSN